MMNSIKSITSELETLQSSGLIHAIKVETEGEGASWQTIGFLAQIAHMVNLPLILKIGGCEARTDIMQSRWLGISGLTAPMIESPFAAAKFVGALQSCTASHDNPEMFLLVESEVGISNLDAIVEYAADKVEGVNFGRSDLTASMNLHAGSRAFNQDDPAIAKILAVAASCVKNAGLRTTVGGRLTETSISVLNKHCGDLLDRVETKRIVLDWAGIRSQPNLLQTVLGIELRLTEALVAISSVEFADRMKMIGELKSRIEQRGGKADFP